MQNQMENQKPSYYEYVMAHDIVHHFRPLWERGGFKLRDDGKFVGNAQGAIEGPWHYIKAKWDFDCFTWHHVIFELFGKTRVLGYPFVPSKCHKCYKVVVRPKTLKQLFLLENLQKALDRPCKCGIEVRDTVHGLYGGYFYNDGLEQGLQRYKEVRKAIDDYEGMGPDVPVILKRACTEFELECGPSDKWEITPEQLKIEEMVDKYLVKDDIIRNQPEHIVHHVHRQWIEWAFKCGDSSYLEFTNGQPLTRPLVTYHHLADQPSALETESPEGAEVKEE